MYCCLLGMYAQKPVSQQDILVANSNILLPHSLTVIQLITIRMPLEFNYKIMFLEFIYPTQQQQLSYFLFDGFDKNNVNLKVPPFKPIHACHSVCFTFSTTKTRKTKSMKGEATVFNWQVLLFLLFLGFFFSLTGPGHYCSFKQVKFSICQVLYCLYTCMYIM